jgi:hypothetical protein
MWSNTTSFNFVLKTLQRHVSALRRHFQAGHKIVYIITIIIVIFSLAPQPSAGYDLLVPRAFLITHNDVPQSV